MTMMTKETVSQHRHSALAGVGFGSFRLRLSRLLLGTFLLVIAALFAGFPFFRNAVDNYSQQDRSVVSGQADGIVVLTGDKARIRTGLLLLEEGLAHRLLISGVHEYTSREAILRLAGFDSKKLQCCVDIGHMAKDTIGNAAETRSWVEEHSIRQLFVVTSDYHMPRSLLELDHALPQTRLVPIVAKPEKADGQVVRTEGDLLRLTVKEYGKYLAARLRLLVENGTGQSLASMSGR